MKSKLKACLSITSIIMFGLAAMASFGPDASTNTTVPISDCMPMPELPGTVNVTITYRNKDGTPIPNNPGRIYVWQQFVETDGSCKPIAGSTIPFYEDVYTDASGTFS